ncbi:MAG: hypothetical protein ACJAVA_000333 [Flavobacteriaceae bacterium]|jgi:hypothetical protein
MNNEETIKYEDYTLPPNNDVLVPMSTYIALTNVIQEVEKEHSKRVRTDKFAFFHNTTHKRLSNSSRAKMAPEKLAKEYYENIDMDATTDNVRVDRDELGAAALRLMGELRGVFRHNIDKGNRILRSELTQRPGVEEAQKDEN